SDVEIIRSEAFPKDHVRSIELNYCRSPFFDHFFPELRVLLEEPEDSLYRLNVKLIRWMAKTFGIDARLERASDLKASGTRSDFLVDICKRVNAETYLSPIGSLDYLAEEYHVFDAHDITILFHNFHHTEYRQVFKPFMPYASALDLLFNEGGQSLSILRSGRRPSFTLKEAVEGFRDVTAPVE
ncbi:MAG: WbqC family protein, partial [Desulfomonile tiedjei]|nr:WbqC family protein [Desulfomonile tiedjei]